MNRDFMLWLVIAGLLIGVTGTAAYKMSRGIRNNNPGNIRHSGDAWQGKSATQTDLEFVQFDSPGYGIRALAKLLKNYQDRYGLNTVRGIIDRYAPPSENLTGSYIAHVAKAMQISPDAQINVKNPETLFPLVSAIITHENGINPYPDALIHQSIGMA